MFAKILHMIMLQLSFQIWLCDTYDRNGTEVTTSRFRADPSILCTAESEWQGMFITSVCIAVLFGVGFPGLCVSVACRAALPAACALRAAASAIVSRTRACSSSASDRNSGREL